MRRPFLSFVLTLALAAPAAAGTHVRVVLDTSRSMLQLDRPRLATLSTLLFYDLALTNSTLGDSFEVIPFHSTQRWNDESDPPPTGTGPRIRASFRDRAALARSLAGLRYDAQMTYFYPGLLESIGELEATPGGAADVRVIVLVTDGLPQSETREEEERLILRELTPRLEKASIRLYVLAFGPQAYPNRAFFERLVQGERLGKVFTDQDGSGLLESMMQIFSRSFGYVQDPVRTLPAGSLDLAAGRAPDRVAVVLFRQESNPPSLVLRTPQGGAVNMADGIREGRETRASYQMAWVLSPRPGPHSIEATAPGARVAVLRPLPVTLEVLPPKTGSRVIQVMGGKEVRLEVLVRPAAGGAGDPGEVDLTYQTHGERAGAEFAWYGEILAPPAGGSRVVPEGRIYPVFPNFPEPRQGREYYVGHLAVTARRGARVQASLSGVRAQRVEVYPLVSISPVPALGDALPETGAAMRALGRWERGCARFRLDLTGQLPVAKEYSLRAVMAASTPPKGGLAGASWTLDGLPLEIDGGSSTNPSSSQWTRGRAFSRQDLFGEHEACIQIGKPLVGDPGRPYELPIELTLLKSPYDAPGVTEPFRLKVLVAPPTWIERWEARLWGGLSLLGLLATFWFLRGRPDLPGDLRAAAGHAGSRVGAVLKPLAESSLASRVLGLVQERPVFSETSGERLGTLRPVRDGLYRFRPARGIRVESPDAQPVQMVGGWADLSVHRTYRLRQGENDHVFRLEYQ